MKLSSKQQEFTRCISQLINFATAQGYDLTFGDAYRDHRLHGKSSEKKGYGAKNSCHKKRLAVDFNLFIDGEYIIDGGCDQYQLLGEAWESMNEFARWGGRFESGDANHFSFEHNGFK